MRKYILLAITVLIVGSIAFGQCITAGLTITGSKTTASKCWGTLNTYTGITTKGGFYYDYEYSAFTKSPISCETPIFNNDAGSFWARNRSWSNDGACATLYGCPTPVSGHQTIYAFWGVNSSNYVTNLLMEAYPANGSSWIGTGTGLPTWTTGTPPVCGAADATFHPAMGITSISCDAADPSTCTVNVNIGNPTYNSQEGMYGTTGLNMIAGYRLYYHNTGVPASGAIANWTPVTNNSYVPYTAGIASSGSFTYTGGKYTPVYLAFQPIFGNRAGTDLATLDTAGMKPAAYVAQSGGQPPYYAEFIPTPVTIASFSGKYLNLEHIALTWVTASESDAAGFNLYRSLDQNNWTQVNSALIPAKGKGGSGATYNYTDNLPKQRTYQKWYYKLDEINSSGQRASEMTTSVTK